MRPIDHLLDLFEANPVIAAVRDEPSLESALESQVAGIFLLNATLSNLKKRVRLIEDHHKAAFVHLEMVAGLSKDQSALEYIKEEMAPTGVITTKPNLIQPARHLGLITVQRLFILDSLSVQTGIKMAQGNRSDFIEVMPGVIPKVIPEFKAHCDIPLIAGGMVCSKDEVIEMLKVGVVAVSTGRAELWQI